MNILKRLAALALVATVATSSLRAQFDDLRYRVEAGVTVSKISNIGIGSSLVGLRLSGQVMLPFEDSKFALHTGLTLTNKGEKSGWYDGSKAGKFSQMYLQLPVELSFRTDINADNRVFLSAGPYLAYGLAGEVNGLKLFEKASNGKTPMSPFEMGLGINVAYAYRMLYLKLGYEMSLTDVVGKQSILRSAVDGGTPTHNLVYLTLGVEL